MPLSYVPGNVALDKDTSQSAAKWGDKYPASKAVDGAIDPLSYQHCAVADAIPGSSTWWKVDFGGNYRISRVIIYNSDTGEYYTYAFGHNFVSPQKLARHKCNETHFVNCKCNLCECLKTLKTQYSMDSDSEYTLFVSNIKQK